MFNAKKEKTEAIQRLKEQIKKLDNYEYLQNLTWRTQTASYIEKFFGKDSNEYGFIHSFSFTHSGDNRPRLDQFKESTNKVYNFLNDCIETIEKGKLYKPPHKNLLSTISNGVLVAIMVALCGGFYAIGNEIGKVQSSNENQELKKQFTIKTDSLIFLKTLLKDTQNIPKASTHKDGKTDTNVN